MMKYLQKLGKALMLPVAALPVAGILMGVGYLLAPAVMGAAGDTTGAAYTAGFLLIKAGGALIDNMAWLFAVGAAVGLADDHDGTAGLAGLVAFLMMQQLLSPAVVETVQGVADPDAWLATTEGIAFSKIAGNSFIGILSAVIGGSCYNKFKGTRLPDWLAFFSGKRCVAIMTAVVSIVVSVILLFVWPLIFGALVALGNGVAAMGGVGAGIYAFLNRLLIPTGLHHACGVTEPFEFGFMFLCFPLYVVYAALYGIFTIIVYYVNFRAGFCFSAGATDLLFSSSLPAAANTWLIIPLGIAAFIVFYLVFRFAITKFNLMTPGREEEDTDEAPAVAASSDDKYVAIAEGVLAAVGGKANVKNVDFCATRLRFELVDSSKVDEAACKKAGAVGVMIPSKEAAQVIIGTQVQAVCDELQKLV